jgi:hypothetical protein
MQSENGILLLFYIFLSHGNEEKKWKKGGCCVLSTSTCDMLCPVHNGTSTCESDNNDRKKNLISVRFASLIYFLLSVSCKMKGETSQISTRLLKTGHDKIWNLKGVLERVTDIELHLEGWNCMPHCCSHCASLSKSFCSVSQSEKCPIGLYRIQSSELDQTWNTAQPSGHHILKNRKAK